GWWERAAESCGRGKRDWSSDYGCNQKGWNFEAGQLGWRGMSFGLAGGQDPGVKRNAASSWRYVQRRRARRPAAGARCERQNERRREGRLARWSQLLPE